MALADLDEVVPLLACPRCGGGLIATGTDFHCSSPECALHSDGSFATVDRWPVLIDFERSIVRRSEVRDRSAGVSFTAHRWSIDRLPRPLRAWWKPRNRVAAQNMARLLSSLAQPSPLILVIGGATVGNGVEAIYADRRVRVLAFDIYGTPEVQLIADAHQIPIADQSIDAVIAQAVLEHVLDPEQVVAEIHRVLRPDGLVYAETPFLQQVHAGPYDFTRFTSSGHRYLFRAFGELAAGPVAGPGSQLLTSVDHLVRGLLRSELAGKVARGCLFWLRYLDRLIPLDFAMDNASAYFFLGHRAERELSGAEIVDYYRGTQGG
jgi:SAM-dependent methyltransferase